MHKVRICAKNHTKYFTLHQSKCVSGVVEICYLKNKFYAQTKNSRNIRDSVCVCVRTFFFFYVCEKIFLGEQFCDRCARGLKAAEKKLFYDVIADLGKTYI